MADKSYLSFEETDPAGKTKRWNVVSGGVLGRISWYGPWRKYTFFPKGDTIFDSGCLKEVTDFLDKANSEHKERRKLVRSADD